MQINQASLRELFTGFRTLYLDAYQGAVPMWESKRLALRVPSGSKEEVIAWLGSISGMKKLEGEIQIENLAAHRYTIVNDEWEDTIAVKEFDIETDKYGVYNPRFTALGMAARQHPDELIAQLLINGFDNSCYTGKNFFDSNHEPQRGGTKFSNVGTKKLSSANYVTAKANIKSRLNAKGRPMNLGQKLLLVVSPQNEELGLQILQADYVAQTAKNTAGSENVGVAAVSNVQKGSAELMVWPQLAANPDMWFLLETGYPVTPLLMQFNLEPRLTSLQSPESDHVFKNHEYLYQAYGRYNAGYGLPELAYGSDGTAAA